MIDLIGYRLPISVQIGMAAFVLLAVGGIALGAVAAIKRDTWIDNLTVGGTLLINSFPCSSWRRCCSWLWYCGSV